MQVKNEKGETMNYSISKFSEKTGISPHTLRYYEKEGLITPQRNEHHYRIYCDEDLDWAIFINKLKNTGISLKELKRYTELRRIGDSTITSRKNLLLAHRITILKEYEKVKGHLDLLDEKIDLYKQMESEYNSQSKK